MSCSTDRTSTSGSRPEKKSGENSEDRSIKADSLELAEIQKLLDDNKEYKSFLTHFHGIVFRSSINWTPISFHGAVEEITGYSEQDFLSGNPRWDEIVFKDDLPVLISNYPPELFEDHSFKAVREYRIRRRDGEIRWVRDRLGGIWDETSMNTILQGSIFDITELKFSEEELLKAAREWQATFDATNDAIWILDRDNYILRCNNLSEAMFDRSPGELLGRHCCEIVHGTDQPIPECPFIRSRQSLHRESMELHIDGSWFLITIDPILDRSGEFTGAVHIVRDISERKKTERSVLERRRYLEGILNAAPDAIITLDQDGRIMEWNPGAEKLFGYSPAEVIGKDLHPLIATGEILDQANSFFKYIQDNKILPPNEVVRLKKDGTPVNVVLTGGLIVIDDEPVGMVAVYTDITEQRRVERELLESEEQLEHSQKMEAVGRLAGGIAHDFNNILCAIIGYADILLYDLNKHDPAHRDVERIKIAAERAASLTNQLLAFSRKQVLSPRILDLNSVIIQIDEMLRRIIGEHIDLKLEPAADLYRIKVDPGQIQQILLNLVVNAADAMQDGGKLIIETANVLLDEEYTSKHKDAKPGPHVMLAVTDTGQGIDKNTMQNIFDPFFTTKEVGKGTGLGLSTVYGIVKQSGGSIWVYSELGKGTSFKIYFPRIDAKADVIPPREELVNTPGGDETIILVEDENMLRRLELRILNLAGYKVIEAKNGGEALLLCRKHGKVISLMVTDIVMPGMSGYELAEQLKEIRPELKVLYTSGYSDKSIVQHAMLEESMPFIQKPFTASSLLGKVREVLDSD